MNEVKDYYQRYWSPAGFDPEGPMDRAVWDLLEQHIGPRTRCVDIGCGDGRTYARWVADLAASYTGFDVSENAVERASAAGLAAEVIEDAGTLPVPDRSADGAIRNEVLEHLCDPLNAVREVQRVLAAGGALICTTPNVACCGVASTLRCSDVGIRSVTIVRSVSPGATRTYASLPPRRSGRC